jgi:hypothetical protein
MEMKGFKNNSGLWAIIISLFVCVGMAGCDSGKEAIDDVTGNKAVKQFQKSKKDIDKTVDKQAEKLKGIEDETDKETTGDLEEEE